MQRFLSAMTTSLLFLSLSACTLFVTESERKEMRAHVAWNFSKNDIRIDIRAAKTINVYKGDSHPIMLAVLQVSNPNDAELLLKTSTGIAKLLSTGESGASQTAFDRRYIQPGENASWNIDRADGTQYIYLIAAYVDLVPGTGTVRSYEVPLELSRSGFLFLSKQLGPSALELSVQLGEQQIVSVVNHSDD